MIPRDYNRAQRDMQQRKLPVERTLTAWETITITVYGLLIWAGFAFIGWALLVVL